ncbi:hypothetical protein [Maricaulis sp.]|uniref:hypothetical protein n=1 Tax=Maricaulis sp. TaxID=1486257 RepID=UPI000C3E5F7A|nr:hypothetical protein [Maricaulis sp.]MAC89928.1 hypothetical protein [Maricaulis sp.]
MTEQKPNRRRPSKKTGMLEVRVSPEEKAAFLEVCRAAGRSASSVIRDAMRAYANFGPMARRPRSTLMIASAFAGASLGAFLLMQITKGAEAGEPDRLYGMRTFNAYAVSGVYDHELTLDEYLLRSATVRETFEQMQVDRAEQGMLPAHDRETLPGRMGAIFGLLFIPAGMDPQVFEADLDRVTPDCWSAMDEVRNRALDYRFSGWDHDQDGTVTAREFSDSRLNQLRRSFAMQDADGDGVVSASDFEPALWEERDRRRPETSPSRDVRPSFRLPETACVAEREWAAREESFSPGHFVRAVPNDAPPPFDSAAGQIAARDRDGDGVVSFAEYIVFISD